MSHWFLCARDVMWAILSVLPIFLAGVGTVLLFDDDARKNFKTIFWLWIIALSVQLLGIYYLYIGAIK